MKVSHDLLLVCIMLNIYIYIYSYVGYFITKIFHPNIAKNGEICVNTLKKDWKPTLGLRHVLLVSKSQRRWSMMKKKENGYLVTYCTPEIG